MYTWYAENREKNLTDTLPEITHIDGATDWLSLGAGVLRTVYQISAWAETQAESRMVAGIVADALHGYEGGIIEKITVESQDHTYDGQSKCYGTHLTLLIVWREKQTT